jgi:glycosyltransferase involved in cell wall biosynthesis
MSSSETEPLRRPRLMLWHWGRRGGGPRYTLELARALAARDRIETHLSFARQCELADDFRTVGLPGWEVDTYNSLTGAACNTLRLPWLARDFGRELRRRQIDVVFCGMTHLWNVAVLPFIRRAGARYALAVHDASQHPGEENRIREWMLNRELDAAAAVVTLTRHVRDRLAAERNVPPARMRVLPHGAMPFPGAATAVRDAPTDRPWRLLFFGRLLAYKGFDLLLEAYGLLRAQFGERITLHVAGAGDIAPFAGVLSRSPGVTIDNRWIGEDEVGGLLNNADLVLTPYREASQSGVLAGACAAGLPCVVTPVGGLTEQVVDRETGLVAAAVSGPAVAAAVTALMTDPALYRRCSQGALTFAAENLSWDAIAAGVEKLAFDLTPDR